MNSFINVLTLFITFPILALAIFIGFDIPFDSFGITGTEIPYRFEVFAGLGFVLFLIQLRRSTRRWMALSMVAKLNRFQWNQPVSGPRKKRVATYNLIEVTVMVVRKNQSCLQLCFWLLDWIHWFSPWLEETNTE